MKTIQRLSLVLVSALLWNSCATSQPKCISKEEATAKITAYVNEQLKGRTYTPKLYNAADSVPRPYPIFVPQDFRTVRLVDGRWVAIRYARELFTNPDQLVFVQASVDEFGKDPRMEECKWLAP